MSIPFAKYFSVRDKKGNSYAQPFVAMNVDVAARYVQASLTADSILVLYPADFELCAVGIFDPEAGEFQEFSPVAVAQVRDLIPDFLQGRCLDGTFKRSDENETPSQNPAEKS